MNSVRRGDIYYADLSPVVGSEQGGMRPVLNSPTVIAAAITSQTGKAKLPTHIELIGADCGLTRDSVILLEQIRTIDKTRLRERMGKLPDAASAWAAAVRPREAALPRIFTAPRP